MGTISSAFNIMSSALNADQAALNVVSNNVANANTPGYTEELPTWQENSPVMINGRSYGTGVTETGSTTHRDRVLEQRLNQQQQQAAASTKRLEALNTLETLFTPDSGSSGSTAGDISSDMTSFFSSFTALEANPTDNALRQQVLSTAKTMAGDISNASNAMSSQQQALDQEASGVASQVNALTTSLAQLNQEIESSPNPSSASTLEDQRQQDMTQLSQLIGINQVQTENNGLTITTTSGQTLVSGNTSYQMTTGIVNGVTHFTVSGTDITTGLTSGGGALGGYLTARDQDIPAAQAALDQLAFGLSTEVNAQNKAGLDLNGNAGTNIFYQPTNVAGAAASMAVTMTDPSLVAAAATGQGTGDNTNAQAMANLATQADPPILNGLTLPNGSTLTAGQTLLNNQTPTNFFSGFVTSLGSTISQVQTENAAQTASVTQLQSQYNSLTAVNLNDEAAAMTTLERSYQSASQVFTILDTLMNSVLNLGTQTAVS